MKIGRIDLFVYFLCNYYFSFHTFVSQLIFKSMNKQLLLSLFALVGVSVCLSAADEARLLRFPATNGNEIVFSYAGDLYSMWVTKCSLVFHPMAKRLLLPVSMMEIRKYTPSRQPVENHNA